MGLSFLAPLFLAGLVAVAIPIIVHLTNRPRSDAYAFPSLMFIARVPFRSERRQRIRHWWLLAIRAGVVALLAAAFARPLWDRLGAQAGAFTSGRDVVILLDNSYSMGYGDRWDRAVRAARGAINGLTPADGATIVLFSDQAAALLPATPDHASLLAALDGARVGDGGTRFGPALQLAREILEQGERPRREAVLISDFQQVAWRADDAVRLPAGTALQRVDLSDADAGNVAVTGLLAEHAYRGEREEVTLSARLSNSGRAAARGLKITLELDGRPVQNLTANVEARNAAVLQFAPLPVAGRPARVTIRAGADALPADNVYHAVVTPGAVVRVLLLTSSGGGDAVFLRRALSVGSEPRYQVNVVAPSALRPAGLAEYRVVIADDVTLGGTGVGALLKGFVDQGGGVLVALGRRSAADAWDTRWRAAAGTPGGPIEPPGGSGARLTGISFDHPVFELFRTPRSGDFGAVHVYRHRRFTPADSALVLARFDDGAPALVEPPVQGRGRLLVWTSAFDNLWTDLPVQPIFLPFVHQMMRYLSSYAEQPAARVVGQVLDVNAYGQGRDVVVETPAGERLGIGPRDPRLVELREAGFYTVRSVGATDEGQTLAVNRDPAESDLSALDGEAFAAAVTTGGAVTAAGPGGGVLAPLERERRQGLWWYLVVGVVLLALAETLLSNRLPAAQRAGTS